MPFTADAAAKRRPSARSSSSHKPIQHDDVFVIGDTPLDVDGGQEGRVQDGRRGHGIRRMGRAGGASKPDFIARNFRGDLDHG